MWNVDEETVSDIIGQHEEAPVPNPEIQVPTVQGHSNAFYLVTPLLNVYASSFSSI